MIRLLAVATSLAAIALLGCGAESTTDEGELAAAMTQGGTDPRYGERGLARAAEVEPESTSALAHDDEGRLVILSGNYDDEARLRADRLRSDGTPDPSFAAAPIPFLAAPEGGSLEVLPLSDGSIVVAASALCVLGTCPHDDDAPARVRRFVFRLTTTGRIDGSFAGTGVLELPSPPRHGLATYPLHLTRSPRGEIVVAADQPNDEVEVRWLDAAGRPLAKQTVRAARGSTAAIAATNELVFVGRRGGAPDTFASLTGIERATGKTHRGAAEWLSMHSSAPALRHVTVAGSSVFVVGDAPSEGDYGPRRIAVHKLGLDLLPDLSFGEGGSKLFDAGKGQGGEMNRIAVLPDGRVVMAGAIDKEGATPHSGGFVPAGDRDLAFVVLRANGAYDTSVAPRGTVTLHAGARVEGLTALTVGPRGVFAAGFSGRSPVATKLGL